MSQAAPQDRAPQPGVVTMYATGFCPYCVQAERLLKAKGVQEIAKIRVDLEPALRQIMMSMTGRRCR